MKNVLTIAGSDSSGGAGIQADIKTMSAIGVYGMSVITAITAQNSLGVQSSKIVDINMINAQLDAIFTDIEVDAVKIGMVSDIEIIKSIANKLREYEAKNIVLDTVMLSKNGYYLLKEDAIEELKSLISLSSVVTPNIPEAEVLSGVKIESYEDIERAALKIKELGAKSVLIKGGHGCGDDCIDTLYFDGEFYKFISKRIESKNTHGTGCTLSSAIASYLALGYSIPKSVEKAKRYTVKAIKNSFKLGHGIGPLGHFGDIYKKLKMKKGR